jgi:hypothetical protein
MFTVCANPDCDTEFNYDEGRLFRFHKDHPAGHPPNTHAVQHFWLCRTCAQSFTLEYQHDRGVLIKDLPETSNDPKVYAYIAVA